MSISPTTTLIIQLIFIVCEILVYAFIYKKKYPWNEVKRSFLIALPAAVVWSYEVIFTWPILIFFKSHSLINLEISEPLAWALAYIAAELHFYSVHRMQHRVHWMWADHRVHHSTTDMNFVDSNRLGWTLYLAFGFFVFYIPFILIGLSPTKLISCFSFIIFCQFFLHTQMFPKFKWIDRIFNTPSNHRVHHASNKEYLDCNYGGVFMIFDHLFGTYRPERSDILIKYGLNESDALSENIFKLNYAEWVKMFKRFKTSRGTKDAFLALFGPPERP